MHLAAWSAVHTAATSTDSAPPRPGAGARGIRLSRSASQLRRPGWHDLLDEPTYDPRRPRDTLLWGVVSEHLEPFLELAAERYQRPLPRYVEKALRAYLSCGDFERGFVRCHCEQCGYDILVPYACGTRSTCPSCAARRMENTAAFLVDRVLPNVPIRQFVLALPWELRPLTLAKPAVVTALGRIFTESVFETYRQRAASDGIDGARCGAVSSLHRAGDSLNANPHWHNQTADGVWFRDTGHHGSRASTAPLRFEPAPPPTPSELEQLVTRIRDRSVRWLRRHGYADERPDEDRSTEPVEPTALEGCTRMAMTSGAAARLDDEEGADAGALTAAASDRPSSPFTATCDGFNLHGGVLIDADDDEGRERIARYCLRPPFALSRLTELGDGRLAYRTRYPLRGGATHRIMEPMELMARLAALVAPPRHPLVRYFGVLSSHSAWRSEVVPRPPSTNGKKRCPKQTDDANSDDSEPASAAAPSSPVASRVASPSTAHTRPSAVTEPDSVEPTVTARTQAEPRPKLQLHVPFNVITAQHLERLLDGRLLATGPRLTWAQLLQRTYAIDLGTCPRCGGRMKPIAQIHDPAVIRRILDHLDDKPAAGHPLPRGPPMH